MQRLKRYLEETGRTQADFGAAVGVRQNVLSRYITGIREPSFAILKRIANESGLSCDELIGYKPRKVRRDSNTTVAA
jgi:transcriptional regulator with XRE-family HTH domain